MKRIRLRIGLIVFLLLTTIILQYSLHHSEPFLVFYIRYIFQPLQKARSVLFNKVPLSIGDILYLLLAMMLLLIIIRVIYFLFNYKKNTNELKIEVLRLITLPLVVYFFFLIFWGGNYARKPLWADWNLKKMDWNKTALITLNEALVDQMNREQQVPIRYDSLKVINRLANELYHQHFGNRIARLKVKPTSLGYMLNYLGIQGYYNPISGEGQFNRFIPPFMHPFVVCHEMAHQAGIAAEDDANLLAYILSAESNSASFRYSAHFNLFLYAYSDLKVKDSVAAAQVFARLNQQSKNDLDTLRKMNRRYRSKFRGISTALYDEYLRLHGQDEGIQTYNDVIRWVYYWQFIAGKRADLKVCP